MKVEEFTQSYFAGKPQALKANIINQINKNFGSPLVPDTVKMVLRSRFSGVGKAFNFENLTDRINLGRGIIDAIYEKPLGIIYEW